MRAYQTHLRDCDFSTLPKADKKVLAMYEEVLENDLPGIMAHFANSNSGTLRSGGASSAPTEKKGWLMKQATNGKWQKRYFILKEGALSYYHKPEAPKAAGVLDLADCACSSKPESDRDFCIQVETPERPDDHHAPASPRVVSLSVSGGENFRPRLATQAIATSRPRRATTSPSGSSPSRPAAADSPPGDSILTPRAPPKASARPVSRISDPSSHARHLLDLAYPSASNFYTWYHHRIRQV